LGGPLLIVNLVLLQSTTITTTTTTTTTATKILQRADNIRRFNSHESGVNVFLISLKAGGLGLNLTAASNVMLCDP